MQRLILNVILLAVFAGTVASNWVLRPRADRPNIEYFPNMAHSPRYRAFSPNSEFADGKTLQAPPSGTIPRGMPPLHYTSTPHDALRAGDELSNPKNASDPRILARGEFVFANYCQECHGAAGKGDGPIALRGFPPPPSLLADKALKMKDGHMFHILTYGQNNMPSYASQISRDDRWMVIAYVRSLQAASAPKAATTPVPSLPVTRVPGMKGGQ